MLYYKVKPKYDNKTRYTWNNHRIDIATANLLCDGEVVGNARLRCARMEIIDKKNNYMW